MPEAIGLVLLDAAGLDATAGIAGLGTIAGTTVAGVSLPAIVGGAAILGASIGLSYALRPSLPLPQNGAQPLQQAIPPRIKGYGANRLAGYYMLFEAYGTNSYDCMAFHSGEISQVLQLYLHNDPISVDIDISGGGIGTVVSTYADGRYGSNTIEIEIKIGTAPQASSTILTDDGIVGAIWDLSHQGNGIAYAVMRCETPATVDLFTKIFPHQLPVLSIACNCSLVWDPRDPAQIRSDRSTWKFSTNPVLHLIDYLTQSDGGLGIDYERAIAPNISQWMAEADICDSQVAIDSNGTLGALYACNGWFTYDNKPESVIGAILATCDGWLAESGDGSLSLTVGLYRAPTDPSLTEQHILGFSLDMGQADESAVNQLDITFTDPAQNYVQVQPSPWRDERSIAVTGVVRSQALDLGWVHNLAQANRLAMRAMARLNPAMSGTITTTLYGLRYLGQRWISVQYPFVSGLQNSVIEIQGADVDLVRGRIVFSFLLIDGSTIEAFNPDDVAPLPMLPLSPVAMSLLREDLTPLLREDGSIYAREMI